MFEKDYYKDYMVSTGFGVDRGAYKHEGVDYQGTKKYEIKNQLSGVVVDVVNNHIFYGNHVIIKSNPRFAKGVDEILFHSYCHLFTVNAEKDKFANFGEVLGKMGNSGNCYTKYDERGKLAETYRHVTEKEQEDENCNFGVHLHLWFYQDCKPGKTTRLLTDLIKKLIVTDKTIGDTHFYQWNKIIYAPRVIYSYFQKLSEAK